MEIILTTRVLKPRILIAPLDWGLGHATRCIPIIKELIHLNCEVIIVATKSVFSLLKKEFPSLVFLRYKGYEIKYSRDKNNFLSKILLQFPKVIFSVWRENKWLKKIIKIKGLMLLFPTTALACTAKKFLQFISLISLELKQEITSTEVIAQKIHYYFIKKYSQCWIPDNKEIGLAGELSHPQIIPSNAIFIGPLSRFKPLPNIEKIYDLLITISGPEPGRTIFENKILNQSQGFSGKTLLIRGLTF